MHVIDVDEVTTWPDDVRNFVESRAVELRSTTEFVPDLRPNEGYSREMHGLLSGRYVWAYHTTRLLDHEVDAIRRQGLRLLSEVLVTERITLAYDASAITDEQRDHLQQNHVFARKYQARIREGRVCLILSRHTLDELSHSLTTRQRLR